MHFRAGELLKRCRQTARAAEHLRRALQLNGAYTPAAEALASLAA